jgi:exodeoxyribonuclease VIII
MNASPIQSRVPDPDYRSIDALNISRLKALLRSPQHYLHELANPRRTEAMALGTAAHCAVLEPERFARDYAVWTNRTASGRMSPRNGKVWDAFVAANAGKTILTEDDAETTQTLAAAVHLNPLAMRYLERGEPEVTLQSELGGRPCKGRVDWLTTIDNRAAIVGLKTARDCRHFAFGAAAAKLGYALQWAFYFDLFAKIREDAPLMVEIVVESAPPHAMAVYRIPDDVLVYGREEYQRLMRLLEQCEAANEWPGPVPQEEELTLPSWCYQGEDDITELGLE